MHITYGRWRPVAMPAPAFGSVSAWRPYVPRASFRRRRLPGGISGARRAALAFSGAVAVSALSWTLAPAAARSVTPPASGRALATGGAAAFDLPGGPGPAAFAPPRPNVLRQALSREAKTVRPAAPTHPSWWSSPVATAARATGIPAALLAAVVHVESQGKSRAVSPAGAMGLMQLEPRTAASLGVRNAFDPVANAIGGARYLALWLRRYGAPDCVSTPLRCPHALSLALAAYNAGPGAVRHYGGIPPYPQTQIYVRAVTALYQRYASGVAASGPAAPRAGVRQPGNG